MKKDKTTNKKSSKLDEIQISCENIFNLAFDIDEYVKKFNEHIKKSQHLLEPGYVENLYLHEEKLVQYMHICAREFIQLAKTSDRGRLAAAKFTKNGEYDLSEYENSQEFGDLTENDVIIQEAKMERIVTLGQICDEKIDAIIDILDTSLQSDEWYNEDSEHAKNLLLALLYDENELHKQFPHHHFGDRHKHMINDIFDGRVEKVYPFFLIENKTEELKI